MHPDELSEQRSDNLVSTSSVHFDDTTQENEEHRQYKFAHSDKVRPRPVRVVENSKDSSASRARGFSRGAPCLGSWRILNPSSWEFPAMSAMCNKIIEIVGVKLVGEMKKPLKVAFSFQKWVFAARVKCSSSILYLTSKIHESELPRIIWMELCNFRSYEKSSCC